MIQESAGIEWKLTIFHHWSGPLYEQLYIPSSFLFFCVVFAVTILIWLFLGFRSARIIRMLEQLAVGFEERSSQAVMVIGWIWPLWPERGIRSWVDVSRTASLFKESYSVDTNLADDSFRLSMKWFNRGLSTLKACVIVQAATSILFFFLEAWAIYVAFFGERSIDMVGLPDAFEHLASILAFGGISLLIAVGAFFHFRYRLKHRCSAWDNFRSRIEAAIERP